eukprot:12830634-Alexandrium_andersonii.AAC.1
MSCMMVWEPTSEQDHSSFSESDSPSTLLSGTHVEGRNAQQLTPNAVSRDVGVANSAGRCLQVPRTRRKDFKQLRAVSTICKK